VAGIESNLAAIFRQKKQFGKAKEALRRALAVNEKIGDLASCARVLANLALLSWDMGQQEEGERFFRLAKEKLTRSGDTAALAGLLNERGFQLLRKDPTSAEKAFRQAFPLVRSLRDFQLRSLTELGLAQVAWQKGKTEEAIDLLRNAARDSELQRGRVSSPLFRDLFFEVEKLRQIYPLLVAALCRQGQLGEAFLAAERAKAAGLLDELLRRSEGRRAVPQHLLAEREKLRQRSAELRAKIFRAQGEEKARLVAEFDANEKEYQFLEEKIWSLVAGKVRPTQISFGQLTSLLPEKSLLLEFVCGTRRSFLLALLGEKVRLRTLPGEEELRSLIDRLVQKLRSPLERPEKDAEELGQLLLGEFTELILSSERLFVVPDGPLHCFPFGTLRIKRRWLVEFLPIAYLPSLTFCFVTHHVPVQGREAFVFGDPAYGPAAVLDPRYGLGQIPLVPLPGSRREAEEIAQILGAKLYLGEEATETKLNEVLPRARLLHLALHCFVHPFRPELSALALSPKGSDDGILELRELNPAGCELAVLSACESGRGRLARGEGFLGFGRKLLACGVKNLVVSLWPVSDVASQRLMPTFWRSYSESRDPAQALRQAKLSFLREARKGTLVLDAGTLRGRFRKVKKERKAAHPFFWAGFVLYTGEPKP